MSAHLNTHTTLSDESLLALMKSGELSAFNEIYKRHWASIYNDIMSKLKKAEQAEQIIEELFADLWLQRETREISQLHPYLLIRARYKVFECYRKMKGAYAPMAGSL